jgi:hypothetical protein
MRTRHRRRKVNKACKTARSRGGTAKKHKTKRYVSNTKRSRINKNKRLAGMFAAQETRKRHHSSERSDDSSSPQSSSPQPRKQGPSSFIAKRAIYTRDKKARDLAIKKNPVIIEREKEEKEEKQVNDIAKLMASMGV